MPKLPLPDPLEWFELWMDEAQSSSEPEPTAMSLATVDSKGQPTVRIVLLKSFDRKGFVFYTNLQSAKSQQLEHNPLAGLCFLWKQLGRQVRIDGPVTALSDREADVYFASRPRGSQIGAWASKQSRPLSDRETLEQRVEKYRRKFEGQDVPRPSFWSGFRVVPQTFEFWQLKEDRLHDRWQFQRTGEEDEWEWERKRLFP